MKLAMYIVANKGLGMSPGKLAAQVAHAAVKAYEISRVASPIIDLWNETGHTKIVLEARDTEHLLMVERYLNERGLRTALIIDEGRTEIDPHTPTALGIEIVDRELPEVAFSLSDLHSYKDRPDTGKRSAPSKPPFYQRISWFQQ